MSNLLIVKDWTLKSGATQFRGDVDATAVLRLSLAEASAKVRQGGPKDDAEDLTWPAWAGVIPLQRRQGEPVMEADSPLAEAPPTRFGRPGQDGAGVAGVE